MLQYEHMSTRSEIAILTIVVTVCLAGFMHLFGSILQSLTIHLSITNDSPIVQEIRYLHDDGDAESNRSYSPWQTVASSGEFSESVYGGIYCIDARTASGTQSFLFDKLPPEPLTFDTPTWFEKWILGSPGKTRWDYRLSQFHKPCTYTAK